MNERPNIPRWTFARVSQFFLLLFDGKSGTINAVNCPTQAERYELDDHSIWSNKNKLLSPCLCLSPPPSAFPQKHIYVKCKKSKHFRPSLFVTKNHTQSVACTFRIVVVRERHSERQTPFTHNVDFSAVSLPSLSSSSSSPSSSLSFCCQLFNCCTKINKIWRAKIHGPKKMWNRKKEKMRKIQLFINFQFKWNRNKVKVYLFSFASCCCALFRSLHSVASLLALPTPFRWTSYRQTYQIVSSVFFAQEKKTKKEGTELPRRQIHIHTLNAKTVSEHEHEGSYCCFFFFGWMLLPLLLFRQHRLLASWQEQNSKCDSLLSFRQNIVRASTSSSSSSSCLLKYALAHARTHYQNVASSKTNQAKWTRSMKKSERETARKKKKRLH